MRAPRHDYGIILSSSCSGTNPGQPHRRLQYFSAREVGILGGHPHCMVTHPSLPGRVRYRLPSRLRHRYDSGAAISDTSSFPHCKVARTPLQSRVRYRCPHGLQVCYDSGAVTCKELGHHPPASQPLPGRVRHRHPRGLEAPAPARLPGQPATSECSLLHASRVQRHVVFDAGF